MLTICQLQFLNFAAFSVYIIVKWDSFVVWTVGQKKSQFHPQLGFLLLR